MWPLQEKRIFVKQIRNIFKDTSFLRQGNTKRDLQCKTLLIYSWLILLTEQNSLPKYIWLSPKAYVQLDFNLIDTNPKRIVPHANSRSSILQRWRVRLEKKIRLYKHRTKGWLLAKSETKEETYKMNIPVNAPHLSTAVKQRCNNFSALSPRELQSTHKAEASSYE